MTPEKRHLSRVASLPCVVEIAGFGLSCGGRVCVHHLREDQGAAQRADDFLTVSLCEAHHQGPNGFHGLGRRGFETRYRLSELDLLAIVLRALEVRRERELTAARAIFSTLPGGAERA